MRTEIKLSKVRAKKIKKRNNNVHINLYEKVLKTMSNKNVLTIATPCYGGMMTVEYVNSLLKLISVSARFGVMIRLITTSKDSLITRARNELVRVFLDGPDDSNHLLFIDSDIGYEPVEVQKMLKVDKDVVCGVYAKKSIDWDKASLAVSLDSDISSDSLHSYCLDYNLDLKKEGIHLENGFGEVVHGATGFMLIKKRVFLTMKEKYPELAFTPEAELNGIVPISKNNFLFFDTMLDSETRRYLSEDYAFCKRWRDIGGKVYADINSCLTHTGPYTFRCEVKTLLVPTGDDEQTKEKR